MLERLGAQMGFFFNQPPEKKCLKMLLLLWGSMTEGSNLKFNPLRCCEQVADARVGLQKKEMMLQLGRPSPGGLVN